MAELALPLAAVNNWRARVWLLVLVLAALGVGYAATWAEMASLWWNSSTFNHCFLIPPIALYLAAQRRAVLAQLTPMPSWWGLAMVTGNSLLWLAGDLAGIAFFTHAAVVGMVIGTCWALLGDRVASVLAFPLAYLYFAVPEGEFLVPYLQDWTAKVLVYMLQLTGIPVFIEGRYLTIPSGNFVVAEACSGINYLIATLAVGAMFMYLNFVSMWRRVLFMCLAVAVPLIANGLRAYGIVMIAHLSDYKYALGVDHFIYGWVFFGLVIFLLFAVGNLFSDIPRESASPSPALSATSVPSSAPAAQAMVLCVLLALFLPRGLLAMHDAGRPQGPTIALPTVATWQGPRATAPQLAAEFSGDHAYLGAAYTDAGGAEVLVEMIYMRAEQPGHELINQTNSHFDPIRWKQLDHGAQVPQTATVVRDVDELVLRDQHNGQEFLLWSWYDTAGRRAASRLPIKLAQARGRLAGAHAGGAWVSVRTPLTEHGGRDGARAILERFIASGELVLEHMPASQ